MAVVALKFSNDERLLASASADKTAKIWNPFLGTCLQTLTGHTKVCLPPCTHHDACCIALPGETGVMAASPRCVMGWRGEGKLT